MDNMINKKAVIFDLDGVIVSTDEYHFRAWKQMADENGIHFNREINECLRGVSRIDSLEIILGQFGPAYSDSEKIKLMETKNNYYKSLLVQLKPQDILPGVSELLAALRENKIKLAVGSSSKNTPAILKKLELTSVFDAVVDGNQITYSKPDPEVFLLAAQKLMLRPSECVVIEDAEAGIDAALAAGMKAVAVGAAAKYEKANYAVASLENIDLRRLLE